MRSEFHQQGFQFNFSHTTGCLVRADPRHVGHRRLVAHDLSAPIHAMFMGELASQAFSSWPRGSAVSTKPSHFRVSLRRLVALKKGKRGADIETDGRARRPAPFTFKRRRRPHCSSGPSENDYVILTEEDLDAVPTSTLAFHLTDETLLNRRLRRFWGIAE